MIAFSIFGHEVYWYGIFYLVTFIFAYILLYLFGKKGIVKQFPGVHNLWTKKLDDFFLVAIVGVIVGGRIGHVVLYDRNYYSQHLSEIVQIQQGGMSFVGGVFGVVLLLLFFLPRRGVKKEELLVVGDCIFLIVPFGIALGRYGNYLNQELYGKQLTQIGKIRADFFNNVGLTTVYESLDSHVRVNTNRIESIAEGVIPFFIVRIVFIGELAKKVYKPGLITGLFLVLYGFGRFFVEFFKDIPQEYIGLFTVSQRLMILFIGAGTFIVLPNQK